MQRPAGPYQAYTPRGAFLPVRLSEKVAMHVLITGAAGYFGRSILPALLADPRVTRVTATDRMPIAGAHPKLRAVTHDLTQGARADLLAGVEAVVHLAFRVERRPGEAIAAMNLEANARFLRAAAAIDGTLLVASSVAAYGFRPALAGKLDEDAPIAPGRGFYYAEAKIAAERLLDELAPQARARIVRARPSMVGGPTVDPRRAAQYRGRVQLLPRVDHPFYLQLLHEADLGAAFLALLFAPAGAYNVAPDDAIPQREAARLVGQWPVTVPLGIARAACDLAWRLGASSLDGEWVRMAAYPTPVADNRRLKALGWAPTRTTRDALIDTVRALRSPMTQEPAR